VSEPVVRAMALGALERSGATVAVAVSGVAGPAGGSPGKPAGTVWLAWARRQADGSFRVEAQRALFPGGREDVRRWAVRGALRPLSGA
jgi:PncC family amidohydrolase